MSAAPSKASTRCDCRSGHHLAILPLAVRGVLPANEKWFQSDITLSRGIAGRGFVPTYH